MWRQKRDCSSTHKLQHQNIKNGNTQKITLIHKSSVKKKSSLDFNFRDCASMTKVRADKDLCQKLEINTNDGC